jgi:hypothetical protein
MHRALATMLTVICMALFGCVAEEDVRSANTPDDAGPEAGGLTDAAQVRDEATFPSLSCEELRQELASLPRECTNSDGCALIGNSCLPSWLFFAVASSARWRASALHDPLRAKCGGFGWDGYIPRAECVDGYCQAVNTAKSCMGDRWPDGGLDSGTSGPPVVPGWDGALSSDAGDGG